jgi:hypothetical protein
MEFINDYKPDMFKNEVPVFKEDMVTLFKNHKVYVFGYGSLLYPGGWYGRWMIKRPTAIKLIECRAHGFERGPWGIYDTRNYYGIIPKKDSIVNGVVTRIWSLGDWVALMSTEMIAGLYRFANYRVVDITDSVTDWPKKPKSARIHCVMNQVGNRAAALKSFPAHGYYDRVWKGVVQYRSPTFASEFLELGGFRSTMEVMEFITRTTETTEFINKLEGGKNVVS